MSSLSVSVIVVNWNGIEYLERCLRHLLAQTLKPERIFVVDNASTDGSDFFAENFPSVTLLRMDRNIGFAAANNRACEVATTEYVALLNPDAFARPDWLAQLMLAANKSPGVSSFASRQMMAEHPEIVDGLGDSYHFTGLAWRAGYGRPLPPGACEPKSVFGACGAAALYRRQSLKDIGGFDEDFFCYFEDVDVAFRLRLAGGECHLVPDAVVYHVGGGTAGGKRSAFSLYHGHRNLVWSFVKNVPGYLFWVLLPIHILQNILVALLFICRGQCGVFFRAKWDAILGLRLAWIKRRKIQRYRIATIASIWRALDRWPFGICRLRDSLSMLSSTRR